MFTQLSKGTTAADAERRVGFGDLTKFRYVPEIHQAVRAEPTRAVLHHHLCASGNRQPLARLSIEQIQNAGEVARRNQLVLCRLRPHLPCPRAAAFSTASKIRI